MTEGLGTSRNSSPAPAVAFAFAALSAAACGTPAICNCPAGVGITAVAAPAAPSSPIVSASADQPCSASVDSRGNDVVVYGPSARTCHVLFQLANGNSYTFSVEFRERTLAGACTCSEAYAADASPPELVDAGAATD
jgi:hypothetical protein